MKTKERKTGVFIVVFLLISVLLVTSVSAGWLDWIKKITGKASSPAPYNVSVTVTGSNAPSIVYVAPISAVNPQEESNISVSFIVTMYDADGYNDLNDTSVSAVFSKATATNEANRSSGGNGSCTQVIDFDSRANYSCYIDMWYWDLNGTWNISVMGTDLGTGTWATNTSTKFTYQRLRAMTIYPTSNLTWDTLVPGAACQNATSVLIINNTGNYNGTINLTAINLLGYSDGNFAIPANNFSVNVTINHKCMGTALANNSAKQVPRSSANRGNLSVGGMSGKSNISFFIPYVPAVSSQMYDTRKGGQWYVAYEDN